MELIILILIISVIFLIIRCYLFKKKLRITDENDINKKIKKLKSSYAKKRKIYDKLKEESAIYDETIELAQLGFYEPHFDFDTSEKYKEEIQIIKSKQKNMISAKSAITCSTEWVLEGSKAKGKVMTNRGIRLTARAFNNECTSAISSVNWNNATRIEQRIEKAFNAINKLNESSAIEISYDYLQLKLDELRLTHEYKEKKQEEKEEQAEIRRQIREEALLEKESIKAMKDEEKYQKLLNKAKQEAEKATGDRLEKLKGKIEILDKELEEAHIKNERAKSMAQQTKTGHVYIISNRGSFGEDVYKIGMTRRLEPLDRVKELGDASVPFIFDVHAMIHSENAPALENTLHKAFSEKRLNLVNNRKEFFNVTIGQIKQKVESLSLESEFIETAEARQYRESVAIRKQREAKKNIEEELPETL